MRADGGAPHFNSWQGSRRWPAPFAATAGRSRADDWHPSRWMVAARSPIAGASISNRWIPYLLNLPEIDHQSRHILLDVRHPGVAHREMMGHDARAVTKLAPELRDELNVE